MAGAGPIYRGHPPIPKKRQRYAGGNIPSQQPVDRVPYSPDVQPDLSVTEDMRGKKPIGFPPTGVYTVSTYDALPPQAINLYREFIGVSSAAVA